MDSAAIALKTVAKIQRQKRKTRPGGQPDGSSHMGAWGGWALAPNTASMGRDYRSHLYLSRKGGRTFKPDANFFNFLAASSRGRFQASACPLWTAELKPAHAGKTRQINNLASRSDAI